MCLNFVHLWSIVGMSHQTAVNNSSQLRHRSGHREWDDVLSAKVASASSNLAATCFAALGEAEGLVPRIAQ